MLECKSSPVHSKPSRPHGGGIVAKPDVAEAAKFVEPFGADFAVIIGPDFENEIEFLSELKTHKVTAFTVSDLSSLLLMCANPLDIRRLLVPGYAMDALADLVWERRHGRRKRVATVAALIQMEGWHAQCTAAQERAGNTARERGGHAAQERAGDAPQPSSDNASPAPIAETGTTLSQSTNALRPPDADTPRLTIDAAMMLVDEALRIAGSAQACTREQAEEAFLHLTDPLVAAAVWLDDAHTAIVIVADPTQTSDAAARSYASALAEVP